MITLIILGLILAGGIALPRIAKSQERIRRAALIEGAAVIRQRAATKWPKNPNAAIEDENCAVALEKLAGLLPSDELKEAA